MDTLVTKENQRLALQATCDAAKTQPERNRLGQFATPSFLAADIMEYARKLLPSDTCVRFLDPGLGTGSFYRALLCAFPAERIVRATGFEIDPHYGEPAGALWIDYPLEIRISDFTAEPPPTPAGQYNLIVCNPPYVRHHHIDAAQKNRLQRATADACGVRFGGLAGLYCHFMGLAHAWLAEDGIAAWLAPSEFMDVNYGSALKTYLLNYVELLRIHRFNPSELQFEDAIVSSAVVWFRNRRPPIGHSVTFTFGGSHASPALAREVPASALHQEAKWTRFPLCDVRAAASGLRLTDFFKIQRGLATGDNRFFIMTRDQIAARGLPYECFKPILPGPRYVRSDVIEAEPDGTPNLDQPLFMLDCRLSEAEIKDRYPSLWTYLESGKPAVSERYLCRYRSPWYSQETRPPAPFMCTYMGRNAKHGRPIRFLWNRSPATAANVYLMLYPRPALANALAQDLDLASRVWEFLKGIDLAALLGEGRVYGGGLHKLEPKELGNVPADALASLLPGERVTRAATQISLWPDGEVRENRKPNYRGALPESDGE